MNKIKIIDLLNMISKGEEVPKYVRYINFVKNKEDIMMVCKENIIYKLDQLEIHLNDEVEIIEEEKKIPEKIIIAKDNNDEEYIIGKHCEKISYSISDIFIANKINEIIDFLKSKGE